MQIIKKDCLKYTSKTTYVTHNLFNKNFAAIHEIKQVVVLNKPIYVEFTVLDLSKWLMHYFHYNFVKKNFSAKLLFTETDSLTYMFIRNFLSGKICLTLVIIQKIQNFMMILIKKLLVK